VQRVAKDPAGWACLTLAQRVVNCLRQELMTQGSVTQGWVHGIL